MDRNLLLQSSPQNNSIEKKEYYAKLSEINRNFVDHIMKCMNDSEYEQFDFTISCKEYINYVKELDESFSIDNDYSQGSIGLNQKNNNQTINELKSTPLSSTSTSSTFTPSATFSFGFKNINSSSPSSSASLISPSTQLKNQSIIFGSNPSSNKQFQFKPAFASSPTLNLQTSAGVSSGITSGIPSRDNDNDEGKEDEEYVPPKPEVVEHQEEGSVYFIRCKLYYKNKEQNWTEKGTGNLNIIKQGQTSKAQLLIRTDNALRNILLNIQLIPLLPISLAPKGKGILLTCIPNPSIPELKNKEKDNDDDNKQTATFLIRVKTPDDAQKLLDQLNKHKGN